MPGFCRKKDKITGEPLFLRNRILWVDLTALLQRGGERSLFVYRGSQPLKSIKLSFVIETEHGGGCIDQIDRGTLLVWEKAHAVSGALETE